MRMRSLGAALIFWGLFTAWAIDTSIAKAIPFPRCLDAGYDFEAAERWNGGSRAYYSDVYLKKANRTRCKKRWTVLVYMAADNNLEPYALWDLYEAEAGFESQNRWGASTARTDVLVELDAQGNTGIVRHHLFQTPFPYIHGAPTGPIRSPVAWERDGQWEATSSLPAADSLYDFIRWGVSNYPSEHYMVVVWGHGQGWAFNLTEEEIQGDPAHLPLRPLRPLPTGGRYIGIEDFPTLDPKPESPQNPQAQDPNLIRPQQKLLRQRPDLLPHMSPDELTGRFGGLAFDDTQGTLIDMPNLRAVLEKTRDELLNGEPVDVYASDACLMQMIEVVTELADSARYVIGSTQIQNFLGLPYRRLLFELNTRRFNQKTLDARPLPPPVPIIEPPDPFPMDEPEALARMLPPLFKSSYKQTGLQGLLAPDAMESLTLSAAETDTLKGDLLPSIERFSRALQAYIHEDPLRKIDLRFIFERTPGFLGGAQDLGVLGTLMKTLLSEESLALGTTTAASSNLGEALLDLDQSLEKTMVSKSYGDRYQSTGMQVLSIWLPRSAQEYRIRAREFEQSRFFRYFLDASGQSGAWPKVLSTIYDNN